MRIYCWTGQRIVLTDGWKEEVYGEVVSFATEQKGKWKMMDIEGGCECVCVGSDASKIERRDEVGRE